MSLFGEVIEHHHDLVLVEDPVGSGLAEFGNGQRYGDVVAHDHVEFRFNELARGHAVESGVRSQYFLSYGHAHRDISFISEKRCLFLHVAGAGKKSFQDKIAVCPCPEERKHTSMRDIRFL